MAETTGIYEKGSPPPTRGKATILRPISAQSRITPAYAGKSPLYAAKNAVD